MEEPVYSDHYEGGLITEVINPCTCTEGYCTVSLRPWQL